MIDQTSAESTYDTLFMRHPVEQKTHISRFTVSRHAQTLKHYDGDRDEGSCEEEAAAAIRSSRTGPQRSYSTMANSSTDSASAGQQFRAQV